MFPPRLRNVRSNEGGVVLDAAHTGGVYSVLASVGYQCYPHSRQSCIAKNHWFVGGGGGGFTGYFDRMRVLNACLAECVFGRMRVWQNVCLAECVFGRMRVWQNACLAECVFGRMRVLMLLMILCKKFSHNFWKMSAKLGFYKNQQSLLYTTFTRGKLFVKCFDSA